MPTASWVPWLPQDVTSGVVLPTACNYPEHWIPADITHTVDVDRGDGITERRFQCPTCGRVYVVHGVTT